MSDSPRDARAERIRRQEREWQNEVGAPLLDKPFEHRGSALVFERQFDRIIAALDGAPDGPLVEIGCGRGQLLRYLSRRPAGAHRRLVGIDVSVAALALPERGLAAVIADGEHLPLRDEAAAVVVYNGSLHHIIDYRAAIREAWRVLRPGGRLVIFEPVSSAFSRAAHRLLDPIVFRAGCEYESPVDQHYKHAFRQEAVLDELEACGAALREKRSDFLAYPLTGCYAGALFTRSLRLMRAVLALEGLVERTPVLRRVGQALAWRFLVVADKAGAPEPTSTKSGPARSQPPHGADALLDLLACPRCGGTLAGDGVSGVLACAPCQLGYPIRSGAPVLLVDEASRLDEGGDGERAAPDK